jgi:hypothetical protein
MWFILGTFYVSMVAAALVVELVFQSVGLVPAHGAARAVEATITFNYTTVLNVVFLVLASALVWRFARTGGPAMLRTMSTAPGRADAREAHHHH